MATTFPAGTYAHMVSTTAGIIHYFRFDETAGTTPTDDVGTLYGVRYGGGSINQAGALVNESNPCYRYDGIDDYVSFGNNISLSGNFSVELWIKPAVAFTTGVHIFFSKSNMDNYPISAGYTFGVDATNATLIPYFIRNLEQSGTNHTVNGTAINANVWTQVVITYDGATLRLYQNGVLTGTRASAGAIGVSGYRSVLGTATGATAADQRNYFNGWLDELSVYNVALSSTTILNHYNKALSQPSIPVMMSETGTITETSTFAATGTATYTETGTISASEDFFVSTSLNLSDEGTLSATETVDSIVAEDWSNKFFLSDTAPFDETSTFAVSTTVAFGETASLIEEGADFASFGAMTLTDTGTLSATESFTSYNVRDSRFYGKIHRERLGLLHKVTRQRYPDANVITLPHTTTIRIGEPETDYFLVQSTTGQVVALGYITTTWSGPLSTLDGDTVAGGQNNHTTIVFYTNPHAHPEILEKFDLPAQPG